ncbi:hypothetical protein ACLEDK_16815 [Lonsdalea quercina]|uniref:hypothetical protein n=1 Tax=Lonsdalea quercina TaxID=71657 RepID=UPI00397489E9
MDTSIVVLVLAISGALYLPWRIVREGHKELVQICLFGAVIDTLAAVYAVLVNINKPHPLMPIFIAVTVFGVVFAADCALSLWIYQRKAKAAKTTNR